ncbi:MAG: tRNA pseudouridine(55) synthase TruB [Gammaproteobacteria bacterium]
MSSGILLINKPSGISSNQALQQAKKILRVKKAGHFGTLDPLAAGLLILGINNGTKLSTLLLNNDKEYEASICLGISTDTDDSEGRVIAEDHAKISNDKLLQELSKFRGEQIQKPPKFSAIKIKGKRLYDYSRKGEEVEIQPRKVVINDLEVLDYDYPILKIRLNVSKGTYIRSIARDLGLNLGVGAHLTGLLRTKQGKYTLSDAVRLEDLQSKNILGLDKIFPDSSTLEISYSQLLDLKHGRRPPIDLPNSSYLILKQSNRVVGLGKIEKKQLVKEFLV